MTYPIARQWAIFAFMALVTSGVLGLLTAELAHGLQGFAEIVIYGLTATFGIEFLLASWPCLWRPAERSG